MAAVTRMPPAGAPSPEVLLIHPPAAKAAEPPLGTAILLGHLRECGVSVAAIDANLEAYLHLLDPARLADAAGSDPPTPLRRALRHGSRSLALLRDASALASFPRYAAAVRHLNEALGAWRGPCGAERLTLGDYVRGDVCEFVPGDLAAVASGRVPTLFSGYFRGALLPRVEAMGPRIVGISIHYRHQVVPAFELAGILRRRLPRVTLVAGGGMISSWRGALGTEAPPLEPFDAFVFGPGEGPLAAMALGRPFRGAGPPAGEPDVRFRPDFDGLPLGEYLSPVPVVPVAASRGCYWRRCLFCPEAVAPTHRFAACPPGDFPDLLLDLSRRTGAERFHLTDDAVPLDVLAAMAARRREMAALSWHGFVRFERPLLDEGFARDLAEAGCAVLHLGLESGSQRILDRLGKGTRLDEASAILENLARAGIGTYVYVMVGMPGERPEDGEMTLRFLEEHGSLIDFLNIAVMNLPMDSPLAGGEGRRVDRRRLPGRAPGDLGLYRSFDAEGGWGRAESRRFLAGRILSSPAVRAIVRRTPPLFTSSHAFLFRERRLPLPGRARRGAGHPPP